MELDTFFLFQGFVHQMHATSKSWDLGSGHQEPGSCQCKHDVCLQSLETGSVDFSRLRNPWSNHSNVFFYPNSRSRFELTWWYPTIIQKLSDRSHAKMWQWEYLCRSAGFISFVPRSIICLWPNLPKETSILGQGWDLWNQPIGEQAKSKVSKGF